MSGLLQTAVVRPVPPKQLTISAPRHPFSACEVVIKRPPRPIRLSVRVNVEDDLRHLAPVGAFGVGIEHAQISDHVLFIVHRERLIGRR
jgi:hypothetical protein